MEELPAGIAKGQAILRPSRAKDNAPQLDKVETALDPASNQPVKVAYYKDGSHEILNDVGAPQDLDIKSVGNARQGFQQAQRLARWTGYANQSKSRSANYH